MDRHILKLFWGYFFASLVALVTLFVAIDALTQLLAQHAVMPGTLLLYYLYYIPSIMQQLIPAACLASTLLVLSGMNKANELTALFTFGTSLARVSSPILVSVAVLSVFSFWMGDKIVPIANSKKNYIYYVDIIKKPDRYSTIKADKIWYRDKNVILNLKTYNADAKVAQGVTFYYFDDSWDLIQMITAKSATIRSDSWTLIDGIVTLFTQDSSFPMSQEFKEKVISLNNMVDNVQSTSQYSESVSTSELKHFIKKNKEGGLDTLRYEVDYYAKFGISFAAFVMSFIGIPFSVRSNRSSGAIMSVGICIVLAFVYWLLFSSGLTLGKHGSIPPLLSAWIANIVAVAFTFFLLLRLKR